MALARLRLVKVISGSDVSTFEEALQDWLSGREEEQIVDSQFYVGPDGTLYERIYYTEG